MIAELHAIRAQIEAGIPVMVGRVKVGDATGMLPPFVVLWAPPGGRDTDEAMAGSCATWAARVGVTCTAASAEAAIGLGHDAIAALTPDRSTAVVTGVAGRHVQLTFADARPVQVDRSVTLPASDSHPAFVVALFDLTSQPEE